MQDLSPTNPSPPIMQPSEELLHLRRDAEKRRHRNSALLGFLVAPVLMGATWFLTAEVKAVRGVGVWIFCMGSIVFAVAYTRFSHYSDKLKNVSQQYSVTVRGVIGPVKKGYRTEYDYARFNVAEFEAHKKMHLWGGCCGGSLFALFSWFLTNLFANQFIWT